MARKSDTSELWERQPGESSKAFDAFAAYRDMPKPRSIRRVAQALGKSATLISRWSSEKEWVKRVDAWDAEQDRIARAEQTEAIKKMRKRHADLGQAMILKAARALQRIPDDEIKASDISRMVEVASKLERISRGDVGEIVEDRDGGKSEDRVQFYLPSNGRDLDSEDDDLE